MKDGVVPVGKQRYHCIDCNDDTARLQDDGKTLLCFMCGHESRLGPAALGERFGL